MYRSFTDRLLGGVCGGIAGAFRINGWVVRALFAVGALLTSGAVALYYAALWLAMPQGSLVVRRGGVMSTLAVVLLGVIIVGGWIAERYDLLPLPAGQSLYLPVVVAVFGLILIVKQVRA